MPPLSMLIKPASSMCNLRCRYCFYHDVANIRETESYGIMSLDTLEVLVQRALKWADTACTFAFQGGEPTLAGLEFFERLIEFQRIYNTKNIRIHNALQTNGTLINVKWAEFLHENKFLIGLSVDGPREINDINRIDSTGASTFTRVMETVKLFNAYKVEYNILTVVSAANARHAKKLYNFYKKNKFDYLQFIPCLDPMNEKPGGNKYSLTPESYALFYKNIFDLWYEDIIRGQGISIRHFDNLVGMFMGYPPEECGMLGKCQCQFVVEADGGVYPCDFYVTDEWLLGNIKDKSFDELRESDVGLRFVESSLPVDDKCMKCKWVKLCRGGCRRSREPLLNGNLNLNYFCNGFKEFFEYTAPRMQRLAERFSYHIYS